MRRLLLITSLITAPMAWAIEDSLAEEGKGIYNQTCVACHATHGKGAFPGVPDLTNANGPMAKSDQVLLENIINGFQSPGSVMAMPAKGGNPSLSEADLVAVLAYLRSEFGGP